MKGLLAFIITALILVGAAGAIDYPVSDQRTVTVKANEQDISMNFHAAKDTVFSIAKTGGINLGDKTNFYGTILLVPSYNDGSEWFLCPLTNIESGKEHIEGLAVSMDNPEARVTCYNRKDTTKTQEQRMMSLVSYTVTDGGKIKIAADIRFLDFTPKDTGFGFYFISLDARKYAMVTSTTDALAKSGTPTAEAVTVSMATVSKDLIVAKEVAFVTDTGADVGQKFDWTDMIDFGYKFSEVITLGDKTGLLLGTYGYGESNRISIDPLYTVDYSPIPAQHLQQGNVTASSDGTFASRTDITAGVSDNSTSTQYTTFVYSNYTSAPQSTGTISPSTSSGAWTSPNNAYADTGAVATATAGLTGYWAGYAFGIPSDANITDITVRLDALKAVPSGSIYIGCVNLSWNNGTSYTSCQSIPALTNSEVTYNLTGLWGRTWTANELNNNFRVQVTTSAGTSTVSLDWIPVTVTYTRQLQNYSNGNAISGKWSVTYDAAYQYFLRVYKTTTGSDTVTIFAYNTTNTTSATSVTRAVSGTGWLNLNVTSLVQYMTTTLGLNYTAFRFYTDLPQNFSEERLRAETNDTTPPTIVVCTFNQSTIYCGGSARLSCDVTDNIDVDTVLFDINSTNYSTTRAIDTYSYILSPIGTTTNLGITYQWNKLYATDILGNSAIGITNLTFIYSCCVPNWVATYSSCTTNDSQMKYYLDSNACNDTSGLPPDNGTIIGCNYCSEDLEKTYLSDCNLTGQRTYDWHDNNVFSCCFMTGLVSDCSIEYSPYNVTNYENCTVLQSDFSIDLDVELQFGFGIGGLASDKAFGKIWLNDTNNTYVCLTYVKTDTGQIVQTNPPYTKRTDATVALTQKEIEDREFFVTQQGLANVYWTNHNLVIDGRQYIFGVECSGNGERLISEQLSTVGYKAVNEPITRWFWVRENILGITLFLLGTIIIIAIVLFMYNRWKYG
jgi:hypothetical protein